MLEKLTDYLRKEYYLIESHTYYLKLSVAIGLAFLCFILIFDPYDNYLAINRFNIPIPIIQIGYAINLSLTIYGVYWLIFKKSKYSNATGTWKTIHHWLMLIFIMMFSGFTGTIYHRFMMDVGDVDTMYYIGVTIPRSIFIGSVLCVISILLDALHAKNRNTKYISKNDLLVQTSDQTTSVVLQSPSIKQCIEIIPQQIVYLKAAGNYVEIYSKSTQKSTLLRASLHYVADKLRSCTFLKKCHRQYYVNIHEIESFKGNSQRLTLFLKDSDGTIPVSKSYMEDMLYVLK